MNAVNAHPKYENQPTSQLGNIQHNVSSSLFVFVQEEGKEECEDGFYDCDDTFCIGKDTVYLNVLLFVSSSIWI